ncbi:GNAT family N-acetyltransferase [Paracrocinitomix mangrovi]|uniref:GNAT family N-acetyltransferase n=1 Tax=Paracrocinitomix mangrovi TaxID=2862509 RepID=UPI001C8EC781|nr:GNAT family N-acetyltransferase [Paracrocinitomix mangrovi]UKN01806.1 GNAT family N-acetyltransferase [Paracrocinitomix mangrovi]
MSTYITARAKLIPYTKEHIPDIVKMFQEPDSNKFIRPLQNQTIEEWVVRLSNNAIKNQELLQFWSVYHKDTNEFIGTMNLNKFSDTVIDQIGLHLARDFWGQGYGFELCQPIVKHAFEVRQLKELFWVFEEGHEASKKLALKLGFKQDKQMEDELFDCVLWLYKLTYP